MTGGPAGADAADAGAEAAGAAGAALAPGAGAACPVSVDFLSLQAVIPKLNAKVNQAKVFFVKFIAVRFFDVPGQARGISATHRCGVELLARWSS